MMNVIKICHFASAHNKNEAMVNSGFDGIYRAIKRSSKFDPSRPYSDQSDQLISGPVPTRLEMIFKICVVSITYEAKYATLLNHISSVDKQ